MKRLLSCACLLAGLAAVSASADAATRVSVKPVYHGLTPKCAGDKMTAKQQFELSQHLATAGDGADTEDFYICVVRSALQGYVPAQAELGALYRLGRDRQTSWTRRSVVYDTDAAAAWLGLASDAGEASASLQLGQMHELGEGVLQSDKLAADYYRLAARQGLSLAGGLAREVENRQARIAQFETRYGAKARAGEADALMAYGQAYMGAGPFIRDDEKAAAAFARAADGGSARAKAIMGILCLRGVGVPRDLEAATRWIIEAAEGGDHSQDWQLYWLHDDADLSPGGIAAVEAASARGILRDRLGAGRLDIVANANREAGSRVTPAMDDLSLGALTKKAEGGDAAAQVNLGTRYLDGTGVAADAAVARNWFVKAAQQNADADMTLGDMAYTATPPDMAVAAQYYTAAALMDDPVGAKNAMTLYAGAGDMAKAYAMAIVLDELKTREGVDSFPKSVFGLDLRTRAEALLYLSEQRLAHTRN